MGTGGPLKALRMLWAAVAGCRVKAQPGDLTGLLELLHEVRVHIRQTVTFTTATFELMGREVIGQVTHLRDYSC